MADYDVIVIGAGLGGLSAGALLARQGRRVLVLEQSGLVGGCCSTFERDGYHLDSGASIVEAIGGLELAFEKLGTTFREQVDLVACDPVFGVILRDGTRFCYPLSSAETGDVIDRFSAEDGQSWSEFDRYFTEFFGAGGRSFFFSPTSSFEDMGHFLRANPGFRRFLPLLLRSYQDVIAGYFKHDAVQQSMAYQSFYYGLPQALAMGPFALLPYEEHQGVYYPRGGMIEIPKALWRCGAGYALEVQLNRRVARVLVRDRKVEGVALADGIEITAPVVVGAVNAKTLYLDMIGEQHLPWLARYGLKSYRYSMSVPMIYLGVDYRPPLDAHHTLFPVSMRAMNEFWWNKYERGQMPDELFGLICCPTLTDPSLAPAGRHIINVILTPAPYRLAGTDWDREKQPLIDRTIRQLADFALPGLADHVQFADCATPLDYERRLLLPEGAIYGLQNDLTSQGMFRPSARSKSIRGLYLAGASTHPGGGVPTCVASGMIAAELIERYEA